MEAVNRARAGLRAECGTNDQWNQPGPVTEPDQNRKKRVVLEQ